MRLAMKRYAWKDGVGVPESVSKLLDEYVYPHSSKCIRISATAACVLQLALLFPRADLLPEEEIPKPQHMYLKFLLLFDARVAAKSTFGPTMTGGESVYTLKGCQIIISAFFADFGPSTSF